jgi:polyferredoxin
MNKSCACAVQTHPTLGRRAGQTVETFFVRYRDHLKWVHAAMFVVFLGIIFVPLLLPDPPGNATPLTNYTTFASYALWGLWFPLVFLSVIFTGRSWCGVFCPMGAAAEWANGVGPQRPIPRWLRWEGAPIVSFLIITILGQTLGVRDHPEGAAEVFGGTMLAAIVIGFFFGRRKRAWCRHACPIGLLLGVFSRLGAVQFAPRTLLPGGESYTEKGACPTMIDLARKTESRHCIECFRCVNPTAKGGVHVVLRRPGTEIETIRDHHANPVEVWFLFLGTGVALGGFLWLVLPQFQDLRQFLGEWSINQGWTWMTEAGPAWLMSVHPARNEVFLWLDFILIIGFFLTFLVLYSVVLGSLTSLSAVLAGKAGADGGFGQRFTELGYQYAPVAMGSLVIGLGTKLFDPIRYTPLGLEGVHALKGGLFLVGLVWSIALGERILARQGVRPIHRWIPLLPGLLGSVAVGLGWWPAIFGL